MASNDHNRRLAEELEKVGYPQSVVAEARMGKWSDFKTPLATPKMELVAMLNRDRASYGDAKIEPLIEKVVKGEFDG